MGVWKNDYLKILGVWSLILAYIATSMTLRHHVDSIFQSSLVLLIPISVTVYYLLIKKKDQTSDTYIRGLKVTIYLSYCWSMWMLQQIYAVADYENWIYLVYFLPAFLFYLIHKKSEWYLLSGISLLYLVFHLINQIPNINTGLAQNIVLTLFALGWYFLHKEMFGRYLFFAISLFSIFFAYISYTATTYSEYDTLTISFPSKIAAMIVVTVFYFLLFHFTKEKKLYKTTSVTLLTVWILYVFVDITDLFSILSTNISYILMGSVIVLTIIIELFSSLRKKKNNSVSSKMENWGIHVPYIILSVLISFVFLVSFNFIFLEAIDVEPPLLLFIGSLVAILSHRYIKSVFLQNLTLIFGIFSGLNALVYEQPIYVGLIFGIILIVFLLTAKKHIEKFSLFFLIEIVFFVESMRFFETEKVFLFLSAIHLACYVLAFFIKKENFLLRSLVSYGFIHISIYLTSVYTENEIGFTFFIHTIYIIILLAFIMFNKDIFIKRFSIFIYLITNFLLYQFSLIGPFSLSFVLVCASIILLYNPSKEQNEEEKTEISAKNLRYERAIGVFALLLLLISMGYQEWNYAKGTTVKLEVEDIYARDVKNPYKNQYTYFSYSIQSELNQDTFDHSVVDKKRIPIFIALEKNKNGIYEAGKVIPYDHPNDKKIWIKGFEQYNTIRVGSSNESRVPLLIIQEHSIVKEKRIATVRIAQNGNSRILSIK